MKTHPLSLLARGFLLLAVPVLGTVRDVSAQPYLVASFNGGGVIGTDHAFVEVPVLAQPWFFSFGSGMAAAERGRLRGLSYFFSPNSSLAPAWAAAEMKFSDLLFTAPPGTTTTTVWLNLDIDNQVLSSTTSGIGGWGRTMNIQARLWNEYNGQFFQGYDGVTGSTTNTTSGILAGYGGGKKSLKVGPFVVPTGVPSELKIILGLGGEGSSWNQIEHAASLNFPGGSFFLSSSAVFDLDPGVTVNSPDAGIVDNQWTNPEDLYLDADKTTIPTGGSFSLYAWNGIPARPVGLFVTEINGSSMLAFAGVADVLDEVGTYSIGPIPPIPALAGINLGLKAATQKPNGAVKLSDQLLLSFQ